MWIPFLNLCVSHHLRKTTKCSTCSIYAMAWRSVFQAKDLCVYFHVLSGCVIPTFKKVFPDSSTTITRDLGVLGLSSACLASLVHGWTATIIRTPHASFSLSATPSFKYTSSKPFSGSCLGNICEMTNREISLKL